jgi:hypothetical protein
VNPFFIKPLSKQSAASKNYSPLAKAACLTATQRSVAQCDMLPDTLSFGKWKACALSGTIQRRGIGVQNSVGIPSDRTAS